MTRNVIYECARFNPRTQQEGESVKQFIIALHVYALAESCEYGLMKEELIRDKLVGSIRDAVYCTLRTSAVGPRPEGEKGSPTDRGSP